MGSAVVLYQSKYGTTKKYAEWLTEELSCGMVETKKASIEEIEKHDVIILGGGIYASGILGISFLKKHYERLRDKKVLIFAVGASPFEERAVNAIKEHNLKAELAHIPFFYCRGAWKEDKMTFMDRTLCSLLKKSVAKKDPAKYEPWEAALMEAIGNSFDWADRENIKPIVEYAQAK